MTDQPSHRDRRTSGSAPTDPFGRPLGRPANATDAFGRPLAPAPSGDGPTPVAPTVTSGPVPESEPVTSSESTAAAAPLPAPGPTAPPSAPAPLGVPEGFVRTSGEPIAAPPTSATLAIVLGIAGLLFFPVLCSIPAWIVGARARRESLALPGRPGYAMATTGWILGIVSTVFWVLVGMLMILGVMAFFGAWESVQTD